ncbi:MAG: GTPase HflX [Kiritimatiellaeota bacterium]|nr:GTPase HflX [Kiritimatiellota bacterium]
MKLYDTQQVERAVLAQLVTARHDPSESADSLLELGRLADTAGFEIAGQITQNREKPDGGTMFGSGKVVDLNGLVEEEHANTVIFDNPLNAIQVYNLARALKGIRIMDRTEVILEIFARRACSAEAQMQVELAQLEFQLSRIPVLQEQQRFKGGIGMKGPGESHLHLRNAPIRRRISELRKRLANLQARRTSSNRRDKREMPAVSMVGYTNAGKSTLLNALAGSDAYVDDRLFATLDTKTRLVWIEKTRKLLLTDTVGFIRNLPHGLVASFKSTLDVAVQADLLMVVVDAAYPRVDDHIRVCYKTLREIGAHDVPHVLVLNKCDRGTADTALLHVTEKYPHAIPVSAQTGYGLDVLKHVLTQELQKCCTLWQLPSATSRI